MTFDYQAALYGPQYAIHGVDAVLAVLEESDTFPIRVIDKTAGIDVGDRGAEVQTIKPVATVRVPELTALGLTVRQLSGGSIAFNDASWTITSYRLRPSPNGEMDGEAMLLLAQRVPLDSEFDSESA